jgi:Domain of unknown function (DUF4404)
MPAESEDLKTTLDTLQKQLAQIKQLDPAVRSQLTAALDEIRTALHQKNLANDKPLMRRLGEAARHFEESHPALEATIIGLIDTLGRSGI